MFTFPVGTRNQYSKYSKVQSNFQLAVKVNDDGEKMLLLLLPLGKCKCALSTLYSHQSSTVSEFPCGLINDCVGVYLT